MMELLSYRINELQEQGDEERILSAYELEQAQKRGHDYLMIRSQLKREIAQRRQMQASQILITYNNHGKPEWKAPQGKKELHFNITHSNNLLYIALADHPLGIDIEYMRQRPFASIARRIMPAAHYQYFIEQGCTSKDFYAYWCAREALIKLKGKSIWNTDPPVLDYDINGIRPAGEHPPKLEIWQAAPLYMTALANTRP